MQGVLVADQTNIIFVTYSITYTLKKNTLYKNLGYLRIKLTEFYFYFDKLIFTVVYLL